MDLLKLSASLDSKNVFKSFKFDNIRIVANKFYSVKFTEWEKLHLTFQLEHFQFDIQEYFELEKVLIIIEVH